MTLEEAIYLNQEVKNIASPGILPAHIAAIKLGIEALKAWREAQREQRWPSTMRLPGETEEEK